MFDNTLSPLPLSVETCAVTLHLLGQHLRGSITKFEMKYVLRTTISIWIKVCYDHAMFYIWNVYIYFFCFCPFFCPTYFSPHMCVLLILLGVSFLISYVRPSYLPMSALPPKCCYLYQNLGLEFCFFFCSAPPALIIILIITPLTDIKMYQTCLTPSLR